MTALACSAMLAAGSAGGAPQAPASAAAATGERVGTAVRGAFAGVARPNPERPWTWLTRRGSVRDYDFIARLRGRPARWDPCRTIRYRINPGIMKPRDVFEVRRAFSRVAQASGLRFRFVGYTSYVWSRNDRYGRAPFDADMTFAFARPGRGRSASDLLTARDMVGVGGPAWREDGRNLRIVRGHVVINTRVITKLPRGLRPGARMSAYLHEIGHAVGLDHANGRDQLMYPVLQNDVAPTFGSGDLAGLRRVGRSAGCLS